MIRLIFASILIVSLAPSISSAGCTDNGLTLDPDTLSQSDVQQCVTLAEDGDTIILPAGAATWSGSVTVGSLTSRTKMVKVQGAGTDASTGTRITCNGRCFTFYLDHNLSALEVSEIRFISSNGNTSDPWAIKLLGHADTYESLFRIHNCYFDQTLHDSGTNSGHSIYIGDQQTSGHVNYELVAGSIRPYIWGLIDNNTFIDDIASNGISVSPSFDNGSNNSYQYDARNLRGWTGGGTFSQNKGDASWALYPLSDHQNSWKAVYIENNTIDHSPGYQSGKSWTDAGAGGVLIFRYNTIWNAWLGGHGVCRGGGDRAFKYMEIYENNFVLDTNSAYAYYTHGIRGANTVFYNNHLWDGDNPGTYNITGSQVWCKSCNNQPTIIYYYRSCNGDGVNCVGDFASRCDGTDEGFDNQTLSNGYLCLDQAGSEWDTVNDEVKSHPVVNWNNRFGGDTGTITELKIIGIGGCSNPSISDHVKEERDYISHNTCSDNVDNDGDGNTDMDDADCVAWWDDTNNKKLNYTAYTYPHPLSSGGSGASKATMNQHSNGVGIDYNANGLSIQ